MDYINQARMIVSGQVFGNEVVDTLKDFYELASKFHGGIVFELGADGKMVYTVKIGNLSNHVQRCQYDPGNFPQFLVDLRNIIDWMKGVADSAANLNKDWNKK